MSDGASEGRYFVLSAIDPETGCACLEARFEVQNLNELVEILGNEAIDRSPLDWTYWVDEDLLGRLVLRKVAAATAWNGTLERFQGALLGYEDWQCDWWAANHTPTWAPPRR